MRCLRYLTLTLAFGLLTGSAMAKESQTIQKTIDGFIRPAYAEFAASTETLKGEVQALCQNPSAATLEKARGAFTDTVSAWGQVELIRFGPVTETNRLERILYWPDRKGIGLKQVQAAIASEDATATDAAALAGKSVAMQGLGALEFVLYGTGFETLQQADKPYRCAYGAAIAGNLSGIAADISSAWQAPDGFARQWANPGPDNPVYRTEAEAATDLIDIFVQGLELVRDVRTNGFLGETADGDKPKQAVFWRANATAPLLRADMAGLKKAFDASGLATHLTGENAYLGGSIDFEFANAAKALDGLDRPVADLLADPAARKKLGYFRVVSSSLSDLFATRLTAALGLSAGFSSLDGD